MFFKFLISLNDSIDTWKYHLAGLIMSAIALGLIESLDHDDDPLESDGLVLLTIVHELSEFFLFRHIDDEAIAIF